MEYGGSKLIQNYLMEKTTSHQIEMKFIKIQETGFYINTEELNFIENYNPDGLNIEFGFKVDFQIEADTLVVHLMVKFQYDAQNIKLLELTTANTFLIKNLKEYVNISDNAFQDKIGFIPTLIGLSIGTIRGILFTRTQGTKLAEHPLPIVNPTELCNQAKKAN
jgi:hypothetical protein